MTIAISAATVAASAISAGASYAASEKAAQGSKKALAAAQNAPKASYNPNADPIVNAISLEALLGLGQGNVGIAQQADPMAQVLNTAQQSGRFDRNEIGALQNMLPQLYREGTLGSQGTFSNSDWQRGVDAIKKALALSGYTSMDEFYKASEAYRTQSNSYNDATAGLKDKILQGRIKAYENISSLAQNFPSATQADIDSLAKLYEDQIRTQLGYDVKDQTDQILQQANAGRINPAATLGRLQQQQLIERQKAPTTALEKALALLQGKQSLGSNAIAAYQSIIDPANNLALNVANLRSQAALNAAQLMANQNTANNQIAANAQQNAANASANGLASAGNTVGSSLASIPSQIQMAQLLKQLNSSPGVAGTPTGMNATGFTNLNGIV